MQEPSYHILSTRQLPDALHLEAEHAGIRLESMSFIATEAVSDESLRHEIFRLAGEKATVVFTSMNAAEAVGKAVTGNPPEWTIYCTGTATYRIVRDFFVKSRIAGTAADASSLADTVIRDNRDDIVFFCGDQRRFELPHKLAAAGLRCREIVVYRTVLTPHQVQRTYEGLLFFSPSAVESFFSVNTVSSAAVMFAIGRTTARKIAEYCDNGIVTAEAAGKDILVRLAIDHFAKIDHT